MRAISFDGLELSQADAADTVNLNFIQSVSGLPGQAGVFDHYGVAQYRQPITINKSFMLLDKGSGDIGLQLDLLRAKANLGRRELVLETQSGESRITFAKLQKVNARFTPENRQTLDVDLEFFLSWPWFENGSDIWYLDTGKYLDDGLSLDQQVTTQSGAGTFTLDNNGGDKISSAIIVIKGASTNPSITNAANGQSISYTGNVLSGSTLYINCGARSVTLPGVINPWSNITIGDTQIGFFDIEAGENEITFAGGGTLEIYWARVY